MAITDTQKVDYLWKKIGYGRAKTDVNSIKNATNESISSPLLLRGEEVWAESYLIPSSIPGSSTNEVTVYPTSSPVECTADITASTNRTWKTGTVDWIPPEIGSTYLIKVYLHTAGDAANAASSGTQVFGAGSGNNDEWFFDYKSGVLNFIGTNLPSGISGKSVYISGAVYTGIKGVPVPGAAVTFTNVSATGIATFLAGLESNDIQIGVTAANEIDTLTSSLILDSATGQTVIDDDLRVTGVSTFVGSVTFEGGTINLGDSDTDNINVSGQFVSNLVPNDDNQYDIGITTQRWRNAQFAGVGTFTEAAVVDNIQIGLSAASEIDTSAGNLVLDSATGLVYVDDNLTVAGNLIVNGSTTQVDTNSITVEDRTIELGIVNGSAPATATTWDLGVLFNYNDGSAKKAAVAWESSVSRFVFGSQVTDGGGTGNSNPQLTYTTYAPVEIAALWVNDCAGQSQVISCTGTERHLENITIDAGTF